MIALLDQKTSDKNWEKVIILLNQHGGAKSLYMCKQWIPGSSFHPCPMDEAKYNSIDNSYILANVHNVVSIV